MDQETIVDKARQMATGKTARPPEGENEWLKFETMACSGVPVRTKKSILAYVNARNPRRLIRLRSDFEWLKKMVKKTGGNPEDARFLL